MAAARPDGADDGQDDVLRLQARREPAGDLDPERTGARALPEGLRGEDVLDLARPDPEGQGPEGAMRARVAVAADDRQAGERQAQLGADHVDDPLMAAPACRTGSRRTPGSWPARPRPAAARAGRGCRADSRSGTLWSSVANVSSGRRTCRPARRSPSKACGLVTSWTRCRSIQSSVASSEAITSCRFQTFSNNVSAMTDFLSVKGA